MRVLISSIPVLLLTGCFANWDIDGPKPPTDRQQQWWFTDADGDGWGDPSDAGTEAEAEPAGKGANNNLDCDDSDATITGRVGSICPDSLVVGGTEHAGLLYGESEYVLVHGADDKVWPAAAAAACGEWGWGGPGGHLVVIEDSAELNQIVPKIVEVTSATAANPAYFFFNIVDDGTEPLAGAENEPPTPQGGWQWPDGYTGVEIGSGNLAWCDDSNPPRSVGDTPDRLALEVSSASAICLTVPKDNMAWFVCERPVPDAEAFAYGATEDTDQ